MAPTVPRAARSTTSIVTWRGRAVPEGRSQLSFPTKVISSNPHEIKFADPDQLDDDELRIRTEELEAFLEGRPKPAPPRRACAGYATGLAIGWNNSTGPTPGQCLNYTIAPPSNNVEQASFSSQSAASSTSEQINVSAAVNVAFDFLTANDTFSFSDHWQSSTNSSNQYFNIYSLYTLNSTVPSSNLSQRPR